MLRSIALFLALAPFTSVFGAEPRVFTVKTLQAQMRYDVTEIAIKPGEDVKIIFENTDDMPHNMVFFQPGTDVVAVSNKQMEKPDEALRRDWLPEDPAMWLHSKMLNPKEKDELVFKAPEKPGIYPFVCTFPGHALSMQGRLRIFSPGPQLTALQFALYLGDWNKLPDFSKLTPHREGAITSNLIEIKLDDYKNHFGIVYSGKLTAPKEGEYQFHLASDDGARLLIDGKSVIDNDGVHASSDIKEGKVKLKAGEHELRVEYFQGAGEAELFAAWQGPDFALTPLSVWMPKTFLEGNGLAKKDVPEPIPILVKDRPVIYRNFISGVGNRGIAVGYPGGINIAWSAERMNLALLWRGAFIDAARHWRDRGGGHQGPLGYDIVSPTGSNAMPLAALAQPDAEWPKIDKSGRAEGYQWQGYSLDPKGVPTFLYSWKGVKVSDRVDVLPGAGTGEGKLVRTIKLQGQIPQGAIFRAIEGEKLEGASGNFTVHIGNQPMSVTAEDAQIVSKSLVIPARPEMKVTYSWQMSHAHHAH